MEFLVEIRNAFDISYQLMQEFLSPTFLPSLFSHPWSSLSGTCQQRAASLVQVVVLSPSIYHLDQRWDFVHAPFLHLRSCPCLMHAFTAFVSLYVHQPCQSGKSCFPGDIHQLIISPSPHPHRSLSCEGRYMIKTSSLGLKTLKFFTLCILSICGLTPVYHKKMPL